MKKILLPYVFTGLKGINIFKIKTYKFIKIEKYQNQLKEKNIE